MHELLELARQDTLLDRDSIETAGWRKFLQSCHQLESFPLNTKVLIGEPFDVPVSILIYVIQFASKKHYEVVSCRMIATFWLRSFIQVNISHWLLLNLDLSRDCLSY